MGVPHRTGQERAFPNKPGIANPGLAWEQRVVQLDFRFHGNEGLEKAGELQVKEGGGSKAWRELRRPLADVRRRCFPAPPPALRKGFAFRAGGRRKSKRKSVICRRHKHSLCQGPERHSLSARPAAKPHTLRWVSEATPGLWVSNSTPRNRETPA